MWMAGPSIRGTPMTAALRDKENGVQMHKNSLRAVEAFHLAESCNLANRPHHAGLSKILVI